MKTLKVAPVIGLMVCLSTSGFFLFGKVEYTKKEKKPCATCHVKAGSKELNDVGKCYKDNNHSLEGCEPNKAAEKKS
jgi:hypothetical protein